MFRKIFFYFTFLVFALSACTITKRQYNNGYHFEWRKHYSSINNLNEQIDVDLSESAEKIKSDTIEREEKEPKQRLEIKNHAISLLTKQKTDNKHCFKLLSIKSKTNHQKLKVKDSFVKNSTDLKKMKNQTQIGVPGIRTPREYLFAALACLVGGIVLVGIAVLFIVVVEVEGLSIGGLLVYFMLIIGGACFVAVPICLLLALFSYLFF